VAKRPWSVEFHPAREAWAESLAQADAFAFDRRRRAILLVGGDKSKDWKDWYKANIPIADARFEEHQARIAKAEARKRSAGRARKERKRR
jgi:hypothetical protein